MTDPFSREVDEDLRSEYLKNLWDRFGVYIIGTALLIILFTAAYRGWAYYQEKTAQNAGDAFVNALELGDSEDYEASNKALEEIVAGNHNGYAAMAQFRIASNLAEQGDTAAAIQAFKAIDNSTANQELKAVATLRAGLLMVDTATVDEMKAHLGALSNPNSSWRHSAREYLALTAFRTGDHETATSTVDLILSDEESLPSIRRRAEILKNIIPSS